MVNKDAGADELMRLLEHPLKAEVEALRGIILGVDNDVRENVKWNAPNYYTKVDFATFNLRATGYVHLLLHTGAKVRADEVKPAIDKGLLKKLGKNRYEMRLKNMAEIEARKVDIEEVLREWIALI